MREHIRTNLDTDRYERTYKDKPGYR